ncbi:MAG TPA: transcriptional repressor LexA [Clostridiales bacterium]|nr:MAG: LexA repressor [Firmicutes bacterium ADurb.Bin262]HOU09553.1 transcriptional repressor LexA [Clostridiales bacterium]HQK72601.1 transcriptional repressor LexA [Clostridiales bacterium]
MEKLTETQRRIYDFLLEKSGCGIPPSVREIGAAVGLRSPASVQTNLNALEEKGYISRDPLLKRTIHINGIAENIAQVPLLGTVAAGSPLLAYEDIEEYLPYSGRSARGKKLFALRVRGDSMVNAGIFDGDIVIAEQTPDARDREIVVALLEDGATVKRFFREGGGFRLQPENDSMEPIYCKEVLILGRVIALIRNY